MVRPVLDDALPDKAKSGWKRHEAAWLQWAAALQEGAQVIVNLVEGDDDSGKPANVIKRLDADSIMVSILETNQKRGVSLHSSVLLITIFFVHQCG